MISVQKVFATFAVVITLGGATSEVVGTVNNNVVASAAKKKAKKPSQNLLNHLAYTYNYSLNYFSGTTYLPAKVNYSVNVPHIKKYEKTFYNYSPSKKGPANFKVFAYKYKLLLKGMDSLNDYVYGIKNPGEDFVGRCQAVIMQGNTVLAMQRTVVPLISTKIRRSDLKKLSKLRGNIMKYYYEKKTRKIYKYGGDNESKAGYKSLRKVWDTTRAYYQLIKKVFEYIK